MKENEKNNDAQEYMGQVSQEHVYGIFNFCMCLRTGSIAMVNVKVSNVMAAGFFLNFWALI